MSFLVAVLLAGQATAAPESHELVRSYRTSERSDGGGSSSSGGSDTLTETVVARRDGGVEIEYDAARDATPEERARDWQLPARVFWPANGTPQLLNAGALEARLGAWLKAAKWDRSMCGRWIFTWNAFHIECNPQSVLDTVAAFDLRSIDARAGQPYRDADALGPGTIDGDAAGRRFVVRMTVDPAAVQRSRAEADVAVGEIMRQPVALETALARRAQERVSGTIVVTFDTDATGAVRKRTKTTTLEVRESDGKVTHRTATETVERRAIPAAR